MSLLNIPARKSAGFLFLLGKYERDLERIFTSPDNMGKNCRLLHLVAKFQPPEILLTVNKESQYSGY
ncbi:hypothetical protein [Candidatus Coxiella mudrowiae]|uniref:hypothetical protein n=1 Tax=Candidatus Coxiella mudrowiae TaxID=2054173 RepID=UPI000662B094|nr:hypothetical protein [Candidatus Coxiella mudrowiae]